ncbi:hypothetical protein IT570_06865 [Candidatus Sumerlaeota bacterium]|nr:hypothetical protein [Candidatus Sumerlaeota bacterium]
MRGVLLAIFLLFIAGSFTGCGGHSARIARGVAQVLIEESLSSDSAQKRTLPWDKLTLKASADFPRRMPENVPPLEGVTPGLWAAGARLKARDSALLDLSRQLAKLPACEAPPGEAAELNLQQFASRRPELNALLRETMQSGVKEETQNPDTAASQLTLTMPLQEIAREVLNQGGGFTPAQAVSTNLGPRARAQAAAKSQAEQALLRDLLSRKLDKDTTYAQWADKSPQNRQKVLTALSQAHLIRSQEVTDASGRKEWVHELELDEKTLSASIDDKPAKRSASGKDGKLKKLDDAEKKKIMEGYNVSQ